MRRFAGFWRAGEQIRALSEELTVLRKDLYAWRKLFRAGGAQALRPLGGASTAQGPWRRYSESEEAGARKLAAGDVAARSGSPNSSARSASSRSTWIFFGKPCGGRGSTPAEAGAWRDGVYTVIEAMTAPLPQGGLNGRAHVPRWPRSAGPATTGTGSFGAARGKKPGVRDAIQTSGAGAPPLRLSPHRRCSCAARAWR